MMAAQLDSIAKQQHNGGKLSLFDCKSGNKLLADD